MQHPSTHIFSPKSRKISSTLVELRELEHITRVFSDEITKNFGMCSDTIMNKIASSIEFNYFHNKSDRHNVIKSSKQIPELDKRFNPKDRKNQEAIFACDAPFIRGCVSIKTKN